MPKLAPQVIQMRFATVECVRSLLNTARFFSEKDALLHVFNRARKYKQTTGFSNDSFAECYKAYCNFKFTYRNELSPTAHTQKELFSIDDFFADGF